MSISLPIYCKSIRACIGINTITYNKSILSSCTWITRGINSVIFSNSSLWSTLTCCSLTRGERIVSEGISSSLFYSTYASYATNGTTIYEICNSIYISRTKNRLIIYCFNILSTNKNILFCYIYWFCILYICSISLDGKIRIYRDNFICYIYTITCGIIR